MWDGATLVLDDSFCTFCVLFVRRHVHSASHCLYLQTVEVKGGGIIIIINDIPLTNLVNKFPYELCKI